MAHILEDAGIHSVDLYKLISLNQDEFFNQEIMDFKCVLPNFR